MNLLQKFPKRLGLQKRNVVAAIDAYNETVIEALKSGDSVPLKGFGTFATSTRKARTGRNPRTGEQMAIPASVVPRFNPSKTVKDALNAK